MSIGSEKERTVALMRAVRRAVCADWTQADYDRNFRETVARPSEAKGYAHVETSAFLDAVRSERGRRFGHNSQADARFFGIVSDDDRYRAIKSRLYADRSFFTSEQFLALQDVADWQNTPSALRQFAGMMFNAARKFSIPLYCERADSSSIRLCHARYPDLTSAEWQMFVFMGYRISEAQGLDLECSSSDPALWWSPFYGPPKPHNLSLVQRYTLAGLNRLYPAHVAPPAS